MAHSYSQWIEYLFWKARGTGIPFSGTFELTSRCNLDCRMCYIHKRANDPLALREELPTSWWLKQAEIAQKQGMLLLLLTGGEPFLRPDFEEIYTGCRNLGLLISINSNGTMITREKIEFLKKNPPLRVNITLYGASRETYARLCGDPDAYDRAYAAVEGLMEAGIKVKINFTVTPENLEDMPKVQAYAKEKGLLFQTASYLFPPVRACEKCDCSIQRITPEQSAGVAWLCEKDRFQGHEDLLEAKVRKLLAGEAVPDPEKECQELPTEPIRCRAGSTTFWVTYKGEMRPCGMMTVPSVNMLEMGFEEAWKATREAREKILFPAKCTACSIRNACELCPAGCWAETGSFTGVPEYLCRRTEAYLREARLWLNERTEDAK